MSTHCPYCHREVDDSDLVEQFNTPKGCVCNPKAWCDPENIPAICDCFVAMDGLDEALCVHCEHEAPCHSA